MFAFAMPPLLRPDEPAGAGLTSHSSPRGATGGWTPPPGRDSSHDPSLFVHFADVSGIPAASAALLDFQRTADRAAALTREKQVFDTCLEDEEARAAMYCNADPSVPFDRCMEGRKIGRPATQVESEISSSSGTQSGIKDTGTQTLKVNGTFLGVGADAEGSHAREDASSHDGRAQTRVATSQILAPIDGYLATCERDARAGRSR